MFVSGMQSWIRVPMMVTTAIIAVPTGIKIFSWLATLWRGVLHVDTPMLFALGFLTMFTLGGISGVMLAMIPITIHVSDTYFIVAHIHYVLFGGSLFTIYAGVYYWFPKMTGRMFDQTLGKLHFWLTFVGVQRDLRADAPHRRPGHAAAGRRLPRAVRGLEPASSRSASLRARALDAAVRLQHGLELARRAARRGEPVAGAHARVAGLLAAADLQLRLGARPSWAARTSTACPARSTASSSRPAHEAKPARPAAVAARRDTGSRPMANILVLANQTIGGQALLDAVRERHAEGDAKFFVVVPQNRPLHGNVIYDDAVRDAAQVRVDLALAFMREEGIEGTGEVGDADPFNAAMDAIAALRDRRDHPLHAAVDLVGLAAARPARAHRAGHGAAGQARRHRHRAATACPFDVCLVVANQTAAGDELIARLKAKAEEGPRRFIVAVPQESGERHARSTPPARACARCSARSRTRGSSRRA